MIDSDDVSAAEPCAIFNLSDRTQIELAGPDCLTFLQRLCTNDIGRLSPGTGREAFLCNVKGRLLGHLFVLAGTESLWIESVPGQAGFVCSHLAKYQLLDNFSVTDRSNERGELLVTGPRAHDCLSAIGVESVPEGLLSHTSCDVSLPSGAASVRVCRVDMVPGPAFLLSVTRERVEDVEARLVSAGAVLTTRDEFEARRIEAAFPVYGIDLTADHLAQEAARTSRTISFEKGCYLGQEPIARIRAMGHVNRELRMLEIRSPELPVCPVQLLEPGTGKEAGLLTSAAWSAGRGCVIGLGMIRTRSAAVGTTLEVSGAVGAATVLPAV